MARFRVTVLAALAGLLLSGCATFRSLADYRAKQMDRCAESCCGCCACPQRAAP